MIDYKNLKIELNSGVVINYQADVKLIYILKPAGELTKDGISITFEDFDTILKTYAFMHKQGI